MPGFAIIISGYVKTSGIFKARRLIKMLIYPEPQALGLERYDLRVDPHSMSELHIGNVFSRSNIAVSVPFSQKERQILL